MISTARVTDYTETYRKAVTNTRTKNDTISYVGMGYRYDEHVWLITHQWTQADGFYVHLIRFVGKTRYTADVSFDESNLMEGE